MNKRTKILLLGSGVTAAMMALVESARHAAADYFVRLALDRETPPYPAGAENQLISNSISTEILDKIRHDAEKLAARPHDTIQIQAQDGTELWGHWIPVPHPKRIIIAMHGWRSAWDNDFGMVAEFFAANDCSVLYAEQRGQGRSGGKCMGFGVMERHDCLEWINWVNEEVEEKLPVYLCGISMGASTVLMAGGLELPENVNGIIADCGYTSALDIWKHVAKHLHISYDMCGRPADRLAKRRLCVDVNSESCPEALKRCRVPVLFVHGTDDRFVPIEMTYENFKACASPKRLFVVPGAEHGMSYPTNPEGYEAALKDFWSSCEENLCF